MGYGYRTLAGIAVVIMAAHTVQRHNERIMGESPKRWTPVRKVQASLSEYVFHKDRECKTFLHGANLSKPSGRSLEFPFSGSAAVGAALSNPPTTGGARGVWCSGTAPFERYKYKKV